MNIDKISKTNRLATVVRRLCKFENMKMKDVATKMGIEPPTLSRNLLNDNPRDKSMEKYAEAFGVPISDFIEYYHNPDGYELTHDDDGMVQIVPVGKNIRTASHHIDIPKKNMPIKRREWDCPVVDEETGEVVSSTDAVSAMFNYKGTKLYANSVQTIKDVANMISMLDTMGNKELHDASLALLVDRYGVK